MSKVEVNEYGTTVLLPCGTVVYGRPRPDQTDIAKDLGYGEDVLAMVKDHDALHVRLCEWLGVESVSLEVAAGEAPDGPKAWAEEAAVMAVQKFMRLCQRSVPDGR